MARHDLNAVRRCPQVVGAGPGVPAAAVIHAPIAVLPTPFPRRSFEKVVFIAFLLVPRHVFPRLCANIFLAHRAYLQTKLRRSKRQARSDSALTSQAYRCLLTIVHSSQKARLRACGVALRDMASSRAFLTFCCRRGRQPRRSTR